LEEAADHLEHHPNTARGGSDEITEKTPSSGQPSSILPLQVVRRGIQQREKPMKSRAVLTLVGLTISFALPTFAQEKEEVNSFPFRPIAASPQIVQQLEAINLKFDQAFNAHDAAAAVALFTVNSVQVTPVGEFSGREAIGKYFTDLFQRFNPSDRITKMSYVYAFGGDLCAVGGWTVTLSGPRQFGGYLINVYTPVGSTWKIRASVFKYPTL
jgi:ketosteroid isomerase-like protein